jgi:phosphogluconate dehydratase
MSVHPTLAAVTARIRERSRATRDAYLARIEQAKLGGPARGKLSCTNLAHAFAAFAPPDKNVLREARWPNIGIVSAYNDMLSAHQPLQRFPAIIGARERCCRSVRRRRSGHVRRRDSRATGHGAVAVQPRRDRARDRRLARPQCL